MPLGGTLLRILKRELLPRCPQDRSADGHEASAPHPSAFPGAFRVEWWFPLRGCVGPSVARAHPSSAIYPLECQPTGAATTIYL